MQRLNGNLNNEEVFQRARHLNIAQYQHIVYYEWLPNFLGRSFMLENQLVYQPRSLTNDYHAFTNPSVINSHTTAAFRFFHSSIQGTLKLYEESRISMSKIDINDHTILRFWSKLLIAMLIYFVV
uniref:Uncharacterized protein n=1 Tax=Anopheles merus TaxID=30066 RepID=A0A182V1S7_ANOME